MEIHVGKRVKERVSEISGLTVKSLAQQLGMHEQNIYDIYRRPAMSTDQLIKMSEVLQVPIAYFLEPVEILIETPEVKTTMTTNGNGSHVFIKENTVADNNDQELVVLKRENDFLKEKLALLEEQLADKKMIIKLLLDKQS